MYAKGSNALLVYVCVICYPIKHSASKCTFLYRTAFKCYRRDVHGNSEQICASLSSLAVVVVVVDFMSYSICFSFSSPCAVSLLDLFHFIFNEIPVDIRISIVVYTVFAFSIYCASVLSRV